MTESDFIPDDKLPKYTSKKLRAIRKRDLGLSMEQLAEQMKCDTRTIQRYETGRSPIKPDVIRKVEALRAEARRARALEERAEQIDFSSALLTPGMTLVELAPIRELLGTVTRIFAAVPKELLPESGTGGQPLPAQGVASLQSSGATSASVAQATPNARGRFDAGFARAACFAVLGMATGCLFSHHVPNKPPTPDPLPSALYTDNATDGNGDMGTAQKSSIPMPEKAYNWQKARPCDPGETDKVGGCWVELTTQHPPCPRYAVEDEQHKCLMPIPAVPKKPNSVEPKK